jgi:ABC-type branched-subunit amino acid transport system substrate-binding protein
MRRTAIAALGVALALGACSTSKDDDESTATTAADSGETGGTDSTTGGEAAATDDPRAPGVTDDEIVIGITYPDLVDVSDVIGFDQGDFELAYQTEVDHINEEGGINGRQLRAVIAGVNVSVTDAAPAACTRLTQDDPVFIAMGFFLGDEVNCYTETNETAVLGGNMTPERLAVARAPWLTTEPSSDASIDVVRTLAEEGELDGTVAVVGSIGDEALYDESIQPVLEEAGIEPVDVAYVDTSSTDTNATIAGAQTIAERFSADGADQVLIIGSGTGGVFPKGLALTDYRPTLLISELGSIQTYVGGDGNDLSVMEGAVTGGPYDPGNTFPELGGITQECIDRQEAAGLEMATFDEAPEHRQFVSSFQACRNLTILRAILEAAGPDLNYGTFIDAAYGLGEIEVPGTPDPVTFGPPPSSDGDVVVHISRFDADTGAFVEAD